MDDCNGRRSCAMRERRGLLHDDLTRSIIGAFFEVYETWDSVSSIRVYGAALREKARRRGHHVEC